MSSIITLKPGRILWHARWQPMHAPRRNVKNSPDYLYMSPQISQALLHGIDALNRTKYVELTKLKVKKPIELLVFKTANEQKKFALENMGLENFKLFGRDDIKIIKFLCENASTVIDGYRAVWDQDQIAVCKNTIREKLDVLDRKLFTQYVLETRYGIVKNNINFVRQMKTISSYYQTTTKNLSKRLVQSIKKNDKQKAIERKKKRIESLRLFNLMRNEKRKQATQRRLLRKLGTVQKTFKRPTVRRRTAAI